MQIVSAGCWQRCALALLQLSKQKLGARIPDEVIAALGGQCGEVDWLKNAEYLLFSALADHRLMTADFKIVVGAMPLSKKFGALFRTIFPQRHVIARKFPVRKHSMKVFGYYPLLWYRLLTKTLPLVGIAFLSQKKYHMEPLARHHTAFNNWLHEKSPH